MAISIEWGTKIITVPQADLTPLGGTLYQLETNTFRNTLKALEAGEQGMSHPDTHIHSTEVTVAGVTFARLIEIANGYSITFEDGAYSVVLVGSNNNIFDIQNGILNQNQVQVIPGNSAGLISTQAIEFGEYRDRVTIDAGNVTGHAVSGTLYPTGTLRQPVDNVTDAMVIIAARGFSEAHFLGDLTLTTGDDLDDMIITGTSHVQSTLTIEAGADVFNSVFRDLHVTGVLDGDNDIDNCIVGTVTYFSGHIHDSGLIGTITLAGGTPSVITGCKTIDMNQPPSINMGGSGNDLAMPNYSGKLTITNMSGTDFCGIGLLGGEVVLDASVTAGIVHISGIGEVIDGNGDYIESGTWNGGVTVINSTVSTDEVVQKIWAYEGP